MAGSDIHYVWVIVMVLSPLWTLILTVPIHCRRSIGEQVMLKFLQIFSDEEKLISILAGQQVNKCSANVNFLWMNYYLWFLWMNYYFKVMV